MKLTELVSVCEYWKYLAVHNTILFLISFPYIPRSFLLSKLFPFEIFKKSTPPRKDNFVEYSNETC